MSCHVAKSDSDEKFTANFIPHDAGRHRLDVKFNGDKVPGSPWFCEVRNSLRFDLKVSKGRVLHRVQLRNLLVDGRNEEAQIYK